MLVEVSYNKIEEGDRQDNPITYDIRHFSR